MGKEDDIEEIITGSKKKKKERKEHVFPPPHRFHFSYFRYRRDAGNLIDRGEREKEREG